MAGIELKSGILKQAFVGMAAVLVQACQTVPEAELFGPYPDNYKEIVKEYALESFYDPYSLKDVSVAEPYEGRYLFDRGWIVCMRVNAKNRMGGYVGVEPVMIMINRGTVNEAQTDFEGCYNPELDYEPWPEMENL
jgi:hypothetical protein